MSGVPFTTMLAAEVEVHILVADPVKFILPDAPNVIVVDRIFTAPILTVLFVRMKVAPFNVYNPATVNATQSETFIEGIPEEVVWLNVAAVIVDPVVTMVPDPKVVAANDTVELIKFTDGKNGVSVPIVAATVAVIVLPADELNVPESKDNVPQFTL